MLLAHRQTADKLWKQLITTTQQSESFRQWCVRIATDCKLVQFIQLTNENKSSSPQDDELSYAKKAKSLDSFVDTLLKFLIFEGCSKEQKTYFLERKFVQLSFYEFQEVGVAFQEAHGCRHTGKDRIPRKLNQSTLMMTIRACRHGKFLYRILSLCTRKNLSKKDLITLEKSICASIV